MRNERGIVSSWRAPGNELGLVSWAWRVSRSLHRCIRSLLAAIENRGRHGLIEPSQRGVTKEALAYLLYLQVWLLTTGMHMSTERRRKELGLLSTPVSLFMLATRRIASRLAPGEPPYTAPIPSGVVRVRMNSNNNNNRHRFAGPGAILEPPNHVPAQLCWS